jgi:hypothetical protein
MVRIYSRKGKSGLNFISRNFCTVITIIQITIVMIITMTYYEMLRMFPSVMSQSSVLVCVGKAPRLLDLRIREKASQYPGTNKVALKTCFADP